MMSCVLASLVQAQISVDVDPTNVTHQLNPLFMGCHSDSGYTHEARGFYAQMVLGESFEALPKMMKAQGDAIGIDLPTMGEHSIKNMKNNGYIRHCSFELYSCDVVDAIDMDFKFYFVKGLDGSPNSISMQSKNFNSKYILPITTEET